MVSLKSLGGRESPYFINAKLEMIDTEKVIAIAEAKLADGEGLGAGDLFVVGCTCNTANEVELLIDADTKVSIEDCIVLSRAIEAEFDREVEDFQLTVASAGVGSELKLLRQYAKLIGCPIEVLLRDGIKVIGELLEADSEGVKLSYEKREMAEAASGKKKKVMVQVEERYLFEQIKSVKEYLDFK